MKKRYLLTTLILSIILLSSCGAGDDNSHSRSDDNTGQDIYDASSYPSSQIDNSNLTGTWLLVMEYDIEYRESSHNENEYRQSITEQRTMISIIDNGSELIAYSDLNECCYVDEHKAWRNENNELFIQLKRGHFVGQISNRSIINGSLTAELDDANQNNDDIAYLTINTSSAGLVKLSSQPSIDGEKALDSWGNANSSLIATGEESPYEQNDFTIHAFSEEAYTWRIFENGAVSAENRAYDLQLHHVPNGQSNYDGITISRFSVKNIIQHETEDYDFLGRAVYTPKTGRFEAIDETVVSLSSINVVSGAYSTNTENGDTFSMDFLLSFKLDR